jgi:hypothetical protein
MRGWYAEGVPVLEIGRRLGRSADAVDARRRAAGLPARRPRSRRWSLAQDALLRASAEAALPATELARRLGLPLEAVRRRRRTLGPTRPRGRPYQPGEDAALRDAIVAGRSLRELAFQLGRTEDALRLRARSLGLLAGASRRWTRQEDELLREGYGRGLPCEAVASLMLGGARTPGAVSARARKLGLATYARAWTAREDALLRRLARTGASLYVAAERHGRTPEAIRRRARGLGVELAAEPAPAAGRRWTLREDALLRMHAGLPPGRLARLLGRTDRAVVRRMAVLGLSRRSPHHLPLPAAGLTPGELRLIARECADGGPGRVLAVARRLDRPPAEVRRLAKQLARAEATDTTAQPAPTTGPRAAA